VRAPNKTKRDSRSDGMHGCSLPAPCRRRVCGGCASASGGCFRALRCAAPHITISIIIVTIAFRNGGIALRAPIIVFGTRCAFSFAPTSPNLAPTSKCNNRQSRTNHHRQRCAPGRLVLPQAHPFPTWYATNPHHRQPTHEWAGQQDEQHSMYNGHKVKHTAGVLQKLAGGQLQQRISLTRDGRGRIPILHPRQATGCVAHG
jgi:hypothetical protein